MTSKIPCLDIKRQYQQIHSEVAAVLQAVCEATAFADGPFVAQFEKHFAEFCGMRFAAGLNSGTSALHLALRVLGIKAGDEVIVPANTFIATAWAVSYVGATPVFVDCTADTWNISSAAIAASITPRTKAIIGVHLYGQPFDIEAVSAIARQHKLRLLEDCAQAQGACYKGKHVGRFGEMGCFSFYPGKNLGAYGEGGAIVTNNAVYDQRLRSLRNHGSTVRYYHDEIGYNMRMDGFQGAILDLKLRYLADWNAKRQTIARRYQQEITNPKITMQKQPEWAESVYHLFVITTEDRDRLVNYLNDHEIFPALHYPVPCHLQKAYAHLGYKTGNCPHAEYLSTHCLSLPMFAELTSEEVDKVIQVINTFN
jgi:dTDP-4-amino-4,6-dideoxygalactose transaminase